MDQITHTVRLSMWKDIILQCQNRPAGMSAKQWMEENQISEKSYYYWQRKFRNELFNKQDSSSTALQLSQESTDVSFAEMPFPNVKLTHKDESNKIMQASAVIKTETLTIEVSNDISEILLSRILQEVAHA